MIQRTVKTMKNIRRLRKKNKEKNNTEEENEEDTNSKENYMIKNMEEKAKHLEAEIAEDMAKEINEDFKKFLDSISFDAGTKPDWNGIWKQWNKIGRGKKENVTTAKYCHKGKLLTKESDIIEAERKEIEERLRNRPIKEEAVEIDNIDKEICKKILEAAEKVKVDDWTEEKVLKVLRRLKTSNLVKPEITVA